MYFLWNEQCYSGGVNLELFPYLEFDPFEKRDPSCCNFGRNDGQTTMSAYIIFNKAAKVTYPLQHEILPHVRRRGK